MAEGHAWGPSVDLLAERLPCSVRERSVASRVPDEAGRQDVVF
jgi:hypothetical protein